MQATQARQARKHVSTSSSLGQPAGIPAFLDNGSKCWTLDSGRWTLDAGLWTLDSGRWNLDAGLWILDSGFWTLDTGLWTVDSGRWTLDAGRWILDSGFSTLDAGRYTLDARLWALDTIVDCFKTKSESSFWFCLIKLLKTLWVRISKDLRVTLVL